jgi:hypothetical protein
MRKLLIVLCFFCWAGYAMASEPNPCGNHGNSCCTEDGGQTFVDPVLVCTNVVNADPSAFCSSYAEAQATAICGDATSFCNGGTAFSLAVMKNSIEQSQLVISQQVSQTESYCYESIAYCEQSSSACAAASSNTNNLSCPPAPACPSVNIKNAVLKCKKVKNTKFGPVGFGCVVQTEALY